MTTKAQDGPLLIPLRPGGRVEIRVALTERLKGHTTSANWLPAGLSPELDTLRVEFGRLRSRAALDLQALDDLIAEHHAEDRKHQKALEHALRDPRAAEAEDRRTSPEERDRQRDDLHERVDADVLVMAEVADRIIATIREQEPAILASLKIRLAQAQEKRREAERLMYEARQLEWMLHRQGQWTMNTSDDGPFGRQPAPTPEPPPAMFDAGLLETSLDRPWHRPVPSGAAA